MEILYQEQYFFIVSRNKKTLNTILKFCAEQLELMLSASNCPLKKSQISTEIVELWKSWRKESHTRRKSFLNAAFDNQRST